MAVRIQIFIFLFGAITVESNVFYTNHHQHTEHDIGELPHILTDLLNPNNLFEHAYNGAYQHNGFQNNGEPQDNLKLRPSGILGGELAFIFGEGGLGPRRNDESDITHQGSNNGGDSDEISNTLEQAATEQDLINQGSIQESGSADNDVSTDPGIGSMTDDDQEAIQDLGDNSNINVADSKEVLDVVNDEIPDESNTQDVSDSNDAGVIISDYQNSQEIQNDILEAKDQSNVDSAVNVPETVIDDSIPYDRTVENALIDIPQTTDITDNDNLNIDNENANTNEAQQKPNFQNGLNAYVNQPQEPDVFNNEKRKDIDVNIGLNVVFGDDVTQGLSRQTNSDLNLDTKQQDGSRGSDKYDSAHTTGARIGGLLIVDPQSQNNKPDVELHKYKDFITFPDDLDTAKEQRSSQPLNLPNRAGTDDNNGKYLLVVKSPTLSGLNQVPVASTDSPSSNVGNHWVIPNNIQTVPVSVTNNGGQNIGQNTNQANQVLVNPNPQTLNNVMSNGYINVAANTNGASTGEYTLMTVPNNAQSYVSNTIPASFGQSTNSGYYNAPSSTQAYYIVQLNNGQNNLIPINNGQVNAVPWNNLQSNVALNNGQIQYVPVNGQNVVIPMSNQPITQIPNNAQIVQTPLNGQVYQVVGPNNPGNMISFGTTSNVIPLVISYKDKVASDASTEKEKMLLDKLTDAYD